MKLLKTKDEDFIEFSREDDNADSNCQLAAESTSYGLTYVRTAKFDCGNWSN
jgi:hypothetical protein